MTALTLRRRRGQPLMVLVTVIASWIGLRALAWDGVGMARVGPLAQQQLAMPIALAEPPAGSEQPRMTFWPDAAPPPPPPSVTAQSANMMGAPPAGSLAALWRAAPGFAAASLRAWRSAGAPTPGWSLLPGLDPQHTPARGPGGNVAPQPVPPVAPVPVPSRLRRWSVDAWLLARGGGSGATLAGGPAPASYGASQAGAVLRYALAPSSRWRPTAYARVNTALGSTGDAELALGLSARPLRWLPVIAMGELRANRGTGKLRLRPAAMLVSQLPQFPLPLGITGEAYAQGGYVGGNLGGTGSGGGGATPFVDGQVTVNHPLARLLGQRVGVGAGAWGGAQKGAARFDVGPSARVELKLNHRISARFTLDYRLRVAGNAGPGSGPALTASTGF